MPAEPSIRYRTPLVAAGWQTFAAALHPGGWVARAVRGGRTVECRGPTCRDAWAAVYREAALDGGDAQAAWQARGVERLRVCLPLGPLL